MSSWTLVGGLDPSLSNFGMCKGLILADGSVSIVQIRLVTTKEDTSIKYKNERDLARARELGKAMLGFFADVSTIYVEVPVGSQSARAMASYGICIGVLAALGKRLVRVSAKEAKIRATGDPKASKQDMVNWATEKYPTLPWLTTKRKGEIQFTNANEHVADAIATMLVGVEGNKNVS